MDSRIGPVQPQGSNSGFGSKLPEEGQRLQQPKHCESNDQDEDNSLNCINNVTYLFSLLGQ